MFQLAEFLIGSTTHNFHANITCKSIEGQDKYVV